MGLMGRSMIWGGMKDRQADRQGEMGDVKGKEEEIQT